MSETERQLWTLHGLLGCVLALIPAWVDEDTEHPGNAVVERLIFVSDRVELAALEVYYALVGLRQEIGPDADA